MKFKLKDIDKKWKEYALAGCICVLFFVCLTHLSALWAVIAGFFRIMSPVIIGLILAYIVNLVAMFFQNRIFKKIAKDSVKWKLSVSISIIVVILIIALLVISLIPQIVDSITSLVGNYKVYVLHLKNFIENSNLPFKDMAIVTNFINSLSSENGLVTKLWSLLTNNFEAIIDKTTSIGGTAMNWLIGVIFAVYFLFEKSKIVSFVSKFCKLTLPSTKYQNGANLLAKFNSIFSRYCACELIDSCIVGVANYIFMIVLRMPNAIFVSFVVGITNLAPTFGPIVGGAIGAFILLLVKPTAVIPFIIFTFVLQSIDGYVIKPKLFGDALNVPGVLILMGIIIFGKLFGVIGILISIPLVAILVYIYSELFIPWLEAKKNSPQVEE